MEQFLSGLDFQRMIFGEEPPIFLFEILFRTVVIYAYTLLLLRWLGSRTVGQLSTVEFLLVIALGSAVGDAMFYPEVPLLHSMVVVTIVVGANKFLDMLIARNKQAERFVDGQPMEVVRDGGLSETFLRRLPMSRDELFQKLREDGIEQLGEVRRAYIEKDGKVTVFRFKADTPPGLRIVPPMQIEPPPLVIPGHAGGKQAVVCVDCGRPFSGSAECQTCGSHHWTPATGGGEARYKNQGAG